MPYCAVRWCGINNMTNDYKKENITFHRFPKSPESKVKWVNAIRLRKEMWYPSYTSVICSRHFKDDCFEYFGNKRRRLRDNAVPTERLYLPKVTYYPRRQHPHRCVSHPECGSGSSAMRVTEKIRDGKFIIGKVYSFLEAEYRTLNAYYEGKIDLSPLADILGRTAEATGVGKRTVTAILRKETYFKCDKHRMGRSFLKPSVLQHNLNILQSQGKLFPNLRADDSPEDLTTEPVECALAKLSKGASQQLVILAPVEKTTDVSHMAEICIEYKSTERHTTPSVIVRKEPDTPKETDTQDVEDTSEPAELILYTYEQPNEGAAASDTFNNFSYATEVETITVEPDIEKLCLQHEPSRYVPAEAPTTCDIQIQTDPVDTDEPHNSAQVPSQIIPQEVNENEMTDLTLDEINNNVQDDMDEPPLQIIVKEDRTSEDEIECMEIPLDDVFWQSTDVDKRYVPREEFREYYSYIGNLI